jgi:uncharacterized membrane protein YphA (DoxX/SURF4 family)
MDVLALIGRLIVGGYFLSAGVKHVLELDSMAGYAASKGVPLPGLAVIGSGLLLVAGGALILLGLKVRWGAWLVILFLIPTSFMMHAFWTVSDPQAAQGEMVNFTKNIALVGAALMIAWVERWPYSLGGGPTTTT